MDDRITASLAQFMPDEPDDAWEFILAQGYVRAEDHDAYVEIVNRADLGDVAAVVTALGEASLLSGEAFDDDDDDSMPERVTAWRAER